MDEKRSGSLSNNFFPEEIWQTKQLDGGSLFVTYGHMDYGREFETSTGPTLRVWGEKCCLCNFICKWLDFLVFSDKDDKPEVLSHNS